MPKISPLSDYVLIEPLEKESQTPSGIFLPETAKEKPQEGKVIAVGPGKKVDGQLVPMTVQPGQVVMYKKWGGTEIKMDGKEHLLVKEEDLLAIIES